MVIGDLFIDLPLLEGFQLRIDGVDPRGLLIVGHLLNVLGADGTRVHPFQPLDVLDADRVDDIGVLHVGVLQIVDALFKGILLQVIPGDYYISLIVM